MSESTDAIDRLANALLESLQTQAWSDESMASGPGTVAGGLFYIGDMIRKLADSVEGLANATLEGK